jgi:hypothetical protein
LYFSRFSESGGDGIGISVANESYDEEIDMMYYNINGDISSLHLLPTTTRILHGEFITIGDTILISGTFDEPMALAT